MALKNFLLTIREILRTFRKYSQVRFPEIVAKMWQKAFTAQNYESQKLYLRYIVDRNISHEKSFFHYFLCVSLPKLRSSLAWEARIFFRHEDRQPSNSDRPPTNPLLLRECTVSPNATSFKQRAFHAKDECCLTFHEGCNNNLVLQSS